MTEATAQRSSARLEKLAEQLDAQDGYAEVVASLTAGHSAALGGVWGSSCALVAANLTRQVSGAAKAARNETAAGSPGLAAQPKPRKKRGAAKSSAGEQMERTGASLRSSPGHPEDHASPSHTALRSSAGD